MKNFIRVLVVIMFLGTFAFTSVVKAQMSGTYTVGTGGTYSSLTSAYNALVSSGVNGPVILSVISDLSGQQQMGGTVTGASAVNTITVTSSTGNPNSYTIGTGVYYSYSLYLYNGVSHVYFKDISIGESNNSTQYYAIYFNQSSTPYVNLEFKGCNINAYPSSSSSYAAVYYYGTSSSSYYFNNLRFIKNNISGGYYNIYLNYPAGTNTNMASRVGVTIDSNVLTNAYNSGIYSYYYAYYPSISHNTITSAPGASTYYGIYTYYYTTIDSMIGNKITVNSTGNAYGMRLYYYQNYSTTYGANGPMVIANNEIIIRSSSSTAYGMYAYSSSGYSRFDIINNSIYINGSSTCYGLYWYPYSSSYPSKFFNNNVHVHTSGTAYMVNFGSTSYMSTSYCTMDYNNYYRTGTGTTTYYGSSSYTSLAAWKSAYSQDANTNGNTINYVDLSTGLEMSSYTGFTCPRNAGVLFDIRNNARGTTTYRGCYEPYSLDAGIAAAAGTPKSAIINQGLSLSSLLKNAGLTTLTSATITWKFKDTLRTPILWTGSLTSGSSANVALGTVYPTSGMNNPVKIWVSNPNASSDQNARNDTVLFNIFGCDSALSGTYTVGGAGAQFATLNDAIYPLMNCGISGPVTFVINSGIYNQAISMAGAINGSSTTNTVTFTSAAGSADSVQIYTSGTTWLLSEISNLRFRDITIGTTSSIGEKGVVFDGNCSNIEFYRCNIYAYTSATSSTYIPVYYSNSISGKCLTNVKFIKNNISGGFVNMCFFTPNSSNANYMGSVTIDSNLMTEGYRGGLARSLEYTSTYYMYFPSISYNTIIGRTGNTNYQYGICLGSVNTNPSTYGYYDNVGQIVGNKIKIQATGNYTCGILLSVYQNYYSPTGSSGGGTQCLVANNEIIHATGDYCSSYGIYAYYSKANIINNSIGLQNTSTSYDLYGIWIYNTSTSYGPMTIKNNNIAVNAADPSRGYPIYFQDGPSYATSSYKIMDYNNYYSTGSNIAYIGAAISDLPSLRSTTQQDANSVSILPSFVNLPNNLKVYGLDLSCPVHSSVLTDMENITRNSTTIMGAYEFVPSVPLDIQPFALVTPSTVVTNGIDEVVSIQMINVGTDTVTSATINWSFNGVAQTPVAWTGSLPSRNTVLVTLDTITPISGTNSLVFITSLPNSQVDTIRFNDTLRVNLFGCDSLLKGTYTVGSAGQFATITDALNAINSCGMGGPVTFAIASGTYAPMSISGVFNGSSATNTITFTSASGNASDVVIGNSTTNYTTALSLNGAKHLIFKNVTIGLNSNYTGYSIDLKGMCENLLFYGCNIQTYNNATGSNQACVRIDNSSSSSIYVKNVRFIKNNMDGGYYNMYFYFAAGSTSNMGSSGMSVTIDSNILTNSYYGGIYSQYYTRYPSVSYNTITSRSSGSVTSNWYGMNFSYYQNVENIVGNKIKSTNTSIQYPYGIYLNQYINYTSYNGNGAGLIANNEIILYTTSSYYGLYLYYPYSSPKVLHNSVYMYGTGNAYAMYVYNDNSSYKPVLKNNNFVTVAGTSAYPIYLSSYYTSSYVILDYNNYYSTGSYVGYAGGTRSTLSALQTATGQDVNSTNMNPGFAATPTNLTPANWSMCPVMTEVPMDIAGNYRYGITYKGCYTAVFARDAGVTEFSGLGQRSTAGTNPLNVRLMNFGTNTLTSVTVQASVDGVLQTPVNLTGLSLTQYKDTIVNIGSFVATVGVTTNLKAWTSNPNGNTDLNLNNDTASLATVGCALVLNGTYDVGGGNYDFATLADALSALANCGVSGPSVLRLASGTYNTLSSLSTVYYGTSETNTVTFTSLAGNADSVVIGAASNTALSLTNMKHVHFTNLTIGNNNTTYGVYFSGGNENIKFYQCKILSNPTTSSSSYACVYYSNSSGTTTLKNVKFIKNHLNGGYYNFYLYYPAGNSTSLMPNMSLYIDSNILSNAYYYGIYSYYNAAYKSISYNTITSRANLSYYYAMYSYYYTNIDTMVGNKINVSCLYDAYGLYLYMYHNYLSYGSTGPVFLANNEIIVQSTNGSVYGMNIYGGGASRFNVLNNSIYISNPSTAYGIYGYGYDLINSTLIIKGNNIFVNNSTGTCYMTYNTSGNVTSSYWLVDYNNWYRSGSGTTYYGYTSYTSFSAWQMASGQDQHSFNQNPNYLAPTLNLHTAGSELLMDPLAEVPYDIDGVSRVPITNMGCYHDFEPEDYDVKMMEIVSPTVSVTTGQTTTISVKIKNFGLYTLDSTRIHYVVNGVENVYNWSGSLAFNTLSSTINVGNFVPISGVNTITVFTTHPNGVQDENTSNDTLSIVAFGCDSLLNGVYTVGGATADYPDEEAVMLALLNCGINGPVEFRFASGNYGSLNFNKAITGASSTNTITFTSQAGYAASVSFVDSLNAALTLYNASNIYFRNVTLNGIIGNYGVLFMGNCNNIEFYGCNILADPITTSSTKAAIYRNGSSGSSDMLSNIRFIKNNISGGYYNVYWYYGGGSTSYMGQSCIIDSNVFTDAYYYGLYLYFANTNFNSISYNKMTCRSNNAASYFYGFYIYYYNNIDSMVGNKIDIRNPSVGYTYPLQVRYYNNYTNNPYGRMLIANNEIISQVNYTSYGGIYIYEYSNCDVINNSIYSGASSTAYGLYLYTSSTSYPIIAKNNNVYTTTASTCYPLYISNATYATPSYMTLDYNNYASTGNYVGYVGSGHTTLAQLRSATLQDTHSVVVTPSYLNLATGLELSDYSGMICNRYGGVNYDITGKSRTLLTPMGAYTVDIYEGYDLSINAIVEPINTSDVFCYQDFASIRLALQNKGSYNLDFAAQPMTLNVEVTGAVNFQADTLILVGSLSPTQKDTLTLTDFLPVSNNGNYAIKAWLSLPSDTLYMDDTIQSMYVIDKIILPYSVNFDSVPKGLVFKQIAGTSGWSVESGAGTNPTISPSHGTGRLQFASATGRGSMAAVTLQPINLRGTASPKMEFWYAHDAAPGRDYTDVKISVDGGFTYSTILNVKRSNAAYPTPTFVRYEIDLSPYVSYSCVIIGFEAGSFEGGNQNIDSICVSSREDLAVGIDVMPQDYFVACELSDKVLAVTLTNNTSQDFNFETNPTQLDVTVTGAVSLNYTYPLTTGMIPGDTILTYVLDTAFDFSPNGTYTIKAVLKSADDNVLNDTATVTRTVNVDLQLTEIDPIGDKQIGDKVYPTVTVKNNSNMPVQDVPLRLKVNNGSDITETIAIYLEPGDSTIYTFINYYTVPTVSQSQPYYLLEIKTELSCDGVIGNNSKSGYYNVILDEFVDLSIISVDKPNPSICDTGLTEVYPIVQIKNIGTGLADNITVYVTVDSAGTILKSYSEGVNFISGGDSITHVCVTPYIVPDFDSTYKVTIYVNVAGDVDAANNTVDVMACAVKSVGVIDITAIDWTMGQNIPNPASTITKVPYDVPQEGSIVFKVMSINGQLLYKEEINTSAGSQYLELNTDNLSNGIYYYSMEYKGQRIVKKLTIQK